MSNIGTFDENYRYLEIFAAGNNVNIRSGPGTDSPVIATVLKKGNLVGETTGAYLNMPDGRWIQTMFNKKYGYVRQDVVTLAKRTAKDSLSIVQKLVENDKLVYESLQRSDVLLQVGKAKGLITPAHQKTFDTLLNRLTARQNAIKTSTVIKWQAGVNKAMEEAKKAIINASQNDPLMHIPIGGTENISGWPAIVIGVAAGAGLSAAAYFVFKPKYDESTVDLKISRDFEALLKKTDPETAKKITDDLEKQIDTAYNQGKKDQWIKSLGNILLPVGLFVGGYFLVSSFIRTESKKNKS